MRNSFLTLCCAALALAAPSTIPSELEGRQLRKGKGRGGDEEADTPVAVSATAVAAGQDTGGAIAATAVAVPAAAVAVAPPVALAAPPAGAEAAEVIPPAPGAADMVAARAKGLERRFNRCDWACVSLTTRHVNQLWADFRLTLGRLLADFEPTFG